MSLLSFAQGTADGPTIALSFIAVVVRRHGNSWEVRPASVVPLGEVRDSGVRFGLPAVGS